MSSKFRSAGRCEVGEAAAPLLVAAPLVGLVVSIGLEWLVTDETATSGGEWPVAAVLIGVLGALAAALAVAARAKRAAEDDGQPFGHVAPQAVRALLALTLAGGVALLTVTLQGPVELAPDTWPIVALIVGLIVVLLGLVVLFTVLRRRSQ